MIVLVKDTKKNSPPKRLDFSGLMPDSKISSDGKEEHKVRIRSGSLSEKKSMEYLISTARDPNINQNIQGDSAAVLVIRSKKHSLDEKDISKKLEAETYTKQMSAQGKTVWTKETLLKE